MAVTTDGRPIWFEWADLGRQYWRSALLSGYLAMSGGETEAALSSLGWLY